MICPFCRMPRTADHLCFPSTFAAEVEGPPEPPSTLDSILGALQQFPLLPNYGEQALLLAGKLWVKVGDLERRLKSLEASAKESAER